MLNVEWLQSLKDFCSLERSYAKVTRHEAKMERCHLGMLVEKTEKSLG